METPKGLFSPLKLLSGFNILNGETFGKVLYISILIAIGLAIFYQITKPTTTNKPHTDIVAQPGSNVTTTTNYITETKKDNKWSLGALGGVISNGDTFIGGEIQYHF